MQAWQHCLASMPAPHATHECLHPPMPLQIPSGILADRVGGAHLAASGLFLWSLVCLQFGCAQVWQAASQEEPAAVDVPGALNCQAGLLMCLEP